MELIRAIGILILSGAVVAAITIGVGKVPSLFSKKKGGSCCD